MKRMKKWKPLLIIVTAMVIYAGGFSYYFFRMPCLSSIVWFFTTVPFDKEYDFQQSLRGPGDMHLEPIDNPLGQKLSTLGVSFMLDTKESIVPQDNSGEYYCGYRVGQDKLILLEIIQVKIRDIYAEPNARLLFEKATGKSPDSEYVCDEALRDVTIWDLSPFDNAKDVGVLILLTTKCIANPFNMKWYRIDTGTMVGFLRQNEKISTVNLFSPEDLNTRYSITFVGFSPTETEAILRSVTLDPGAK